MSFQWIFDKAETISINRKKMVAQTTARDGQVRSVSRGTMPKVFTVKVPDGIAYSDLKSSIEAAEVLDRITSDSITISSTRFPWFTASNQTYTVRCTTFPEWTIFARNQVSWSGPFIFTEVL
jgi:hypothetical protein